MLAMAAGGLAAGSWWWMAAMAGAVGVVGSLSDRQLGHAVVIASLVLTGGVVAADRSWALPVVAAGVFASFEFLAVADRVTTVRPSVVGTTPAVGRGVVIAAGTSILVLVAGAATSGVPVLVTALAAAAATVALRVVAR